jgi:hypothetical protein
MRSFKNLKPGTKLSLSAEMRVENFKKSYKFGGKNMLCNSNCVFYEQISLDPYRRIVTITNVRAPFIP